MLGLAAILATSSAGATSNEAVDVLIVLAVDVSASISDGRGGTQSQYLLQRDGIVQALRDPEVSKVLEQCNGQGAGITYMEWSGENSRPMTKQVVGWRVLRSSSDLHRFASELENIRSRSSNGSTDVVSALKYSAELLTTAPYSASRRIISLSTDGAHNVPGSNANEETETKEVVLISSLQKERDRILSQDMMIDALIIKNDPWNMGGDEGLEDYYRRHVIGGPGARVVPVGGFEQYAEGLKQKLLSELDNCMM